MAAYGVSSHLGTYAHWMQEGTRPNPYRPESVASRLGKIISEVVTHPNAGAESRCRNVTAFQAIECLINHLVAILEHELLIPRIA